jgi:hypothetical protein
MDLEELQKRIYEKKGDNIEGRPEAPQIFEPGHESMTPPPETPQWSENDAKKLAFGNTIRKILWGAGILAAATAVGLVIWLIFRQGQSFDKTKVALNIYGQDRIVSGEEINFVVSIKNNTNVTLQNAVLDFIYSQQSAPSDSQGLKQQGNLPVSTKNLGDIGAGQEMQLEFKTRVLGDKDSQQNFSAKLTYRPSNFNSDFNGETNFSSTIISVPLVLNFDLPEKIVSGQEVNFTLKYLNTSDVTFSDFKIKLDYPAGFNFENSYPSPSEGNNVWPLAEISSQEQGQIMIRGTLNGEEGESKIFNAQIGTQKDENFIAYAQTLASPQIAVSPLYVEQTLNNNEKLTADLSQTLEYRIKYRNTTSVTIGPVVISLKIDSRAVDWSSVRSLNGFFSSVDNTITWNASSLPDLNSLSGNQEGEISFSLRLKDKLPINSFSDKNFTIVTTAQIDSPNVPITLVGTQLKGINQMTVNVKSRLSLNVKGYFNDNLMPNSGPIPPRVGQRTTYTIYLQLLNVSNDLGDVTAEASLPLSVQWLDRIYPAGEDLRYDAATGKIAWHIDRLPAATGILSPVKQVVFQVAFTPSISQASSFADIVQVAKATGTDLFTQDIITTVEKTLNTTMPDDPIIGGHSEMGIVQQ